MYATAQIATGAAAAGLIASAGSAAALGPIGIGVAILGIALGSFSKTKTEVISDEVELNLEAFDGWRWCIGVRDITIMSQTFEPTSEIISTPWRSDGPIVSIALQAREIIPSYIFESGESRPIEHYISIDDGHSWHPISPEGKDDQDIPEVYHINSSVLPETRSSRIGYLTSESDVYEVRYRAILKRPTKPDDAQYYSPALAGYTLKLGVEVQG